MDRLSWRMGNYNLNTYITTSCECILVCVLANYEGKESISIHCFKINGSNNNNFCCRSHAYLLWFTSTTYSTHITKTYKIGSFPLCDTYIILGSYNKHILESHEWIVKFRSTIYIYIGRYTSDRQKALTWINFSQDECNKVLLV